MSDQKISALLAISLISSPIALPASAPSYSDDPKTVAAAISSFDAVSRRAAARKMQLQLAPPQVLQPMGAYVGQLQEKWQFPSDHLPIVQTFLRLSSGQRQLTISWCAPQADLLLS